MTGTQILAEGLAREGADMIFGCAGAKTRGNIMIVCNLVGDKVADLSPTSITAELSDTPEHSETFEDTMRPYGILEVVRTGGIALQKGPGKI